MLAFNLFLTGIARPTIEHRNAKILNLAVKVLFSLAKLDLHDSVVNAGKCDNRLAK